MHTEVVFHVASCTSKTAFDLSLAAVQGTIFGTDETLYLPDWRLGRRVLDLCHRDTKDQSQRDSAAQPERNRTVDTASKLIQRWQDTHFKIILCIAKPN